MDDMPELYLTGSDAARWLGVTAFQLRALAKALDIEACDGTVGGTCRYRKPHLRELKSCAGIMRETGVDSVASVKVHRALQARAAAKTSEASS